MSHHEFKIDLAAEIWWWDQQEKSFGEGNLEKSSKWIKGVWDVLQWKDWERIRFAFEIGSTEIWEYFAKDLCTPKETQNPKQD